MPLLSDLLADRVEEPEASAAWAHVAECGICRSVLTTVHEVRAAVASEKERLFSRHPSPAEIVRYSTGDLASDTASTVQMEHHLRECDTCRTEVDLVKNADQATRLDARKPRLEWRLFTEWWPQMPRLVPAMAGIMLLLAYPAYRGMVAYPSLERAYQDSQGEAARLESEGVQLRRELADRPAAAAWTGGVRLLVLGPTTRAVEAPPIVVLAAGQPYLPMVIEHRPFDVGERETPVEIVIRRTADGVDAWRLERSAQELWDPTLNAMVVLVPASVLESGTYRVQMRRQGTLRFDADFDVRTPR